VVGNEGVADISLLMGGVGTPKRAAVPSAGHRHRLCSLGIEEAFNRTGTVIHVMPRYTQARMTCVAQTAVCNRDHSPFQQLGRWLLLGLDRMQGNDPVMTQERIANRLGLRREGGHRSRGAGSASGRRNSRDLTAARYRYAGLWSGRLRSPVGVYRKAER